MSIRLPSTAQPTLEWGVLSILPSDESIMLSTKEKNFPTEERNFSTEERNFFAQEREFPVNESRMVPTEEPSKLSRKKLS